MKNSVFEPLEERRHIFLHGKAVVIQKIWRGFVTHRGTLLFELEHNKTNKMTCASAQTDQYLLWVLCVTKDPCFLQADSEDSD